MASDSKPASGTVLVVGASGNVGGATARALLRHGREVRPAGTDPDRLQETFPGTAPVLLDLRAPDTFARALDGVESVLLVRPPAISRVGPTLNAFVDAAAEAEVRHLVFASVTGADTNRLVPHHRVETHLRRSRLTWTVLRPGFFAQNLADAYGDDVREGRIVLPAGRGRAAFVDVRDVGEVAAGVLTAPGRHRAAGYTLTGPRAVGFTEVAEILSRELGRSVVYEPVGAPTYLRRLLLRGAPVTQALVQTVLHHDLRRGGGAKVDGTLERLLGRPATSVEQYVHDLREVWQPAVAAPRPGGTPSSAVTS